MGWLYYPNEFEKACLQGILSITEQEERKSNQGIFRWIEHWDVGMRLCGHRLEYCLGKNRLSESIGVVNSIARSFPDICIMGEADLSDELKTKLFNDPQRASYMEVSNLPATLILWYYPEEGLSLEHYFDKEGKDFFRKFPKCRAFFEEARKLKEFDFDKVKNFAIKGTELAIYYHKRDGIATKKRIEALHHEMSK